MAPEDARNTAAVGEEAYVAARSLSAIFYISTDRRRLPEDIQGYMTCCSIEDVQFGSIED
jgi:hypothetical protein